MTLDSVSVAVWIGPANSAIPTGLLGGASPSTGPGVTIATAVFRTTAMNKVPAKIRRYIDARRPLGNNSSKATTRPMGGWNAQAATHAEKAPSGQLPPLARSARAYGPPAIAAAMENVMPHRIHPILLSGRRETISAPTKPNPTHPPPQMKFATASTASK